MNQKRIAVLVSTLSLVLSIMVLAGCMPGESTDVVAGASSSEEVVQSSMADRHLFHDRLWLDRVTEVTSGPILPDNWDMVDRIRFQDQRDLPESNSVAPVVEGGMTMTDRHRFHDLLWASQPEGNN